MSTEMITFGIGILSALCILLERLFRIGHLFAKLPNRVARILTASVIVGIVALFATQIVQYASAATANKEKRRIEQEYARVLYLFSENKLDLTSQFLKDKQYVAGYQAYRNQDFSAAKGHFRQSIAENRFVPESHYLLAYIALLENEKSGGGDLSDAMTDVGLAISEDRDYIPPYYLRGILEVKVNRIKDGLEDLKVAVLADGTACYDLQQPVEINRWWARVAQDAGFVAVQAQCKAKWGVSPMTRP